MKILKDLDSFSLNFENLQLLQRFLAAFSQDGLMNILKALKGFGKEVIDMFDTLSKPVQDDILKAFPIIGSYATSNILPLSYSVPFIEYNYLYVTVVIIFRRYCSFDITEVG